VKILNLSACWELIIFVSREGRKGYAKNAKLIILCDLCENLRALCVNHLLDCFVTMFLATTCIESFYMTVAVSVLKWALEKDVFLG
jgi:hypothetical protein